ncbi:hypothetical protein RFN58_35085 [Streptomyces iakyrus]|uniref:hypothetical protein n=1 Tax=Streptomyces iakyrus TaxID=68219 RepID=UPI0012FF2D3A|nr:hypothetical protein [Streptomyces iakyrus]
MGVLSLVPGVSEGHRGGVAAVGMVMCGQGVHREYGKHHREERCHQQRSRAVAATDLA